MNTTRKCSPSPKGRQQLEALRRTARAVLERKRRLGQYVVVWKEGHPVMMGADAPGSREDES